MRKKLKQAVLTGAVASSLALSAAAMEQIQDEQLADVSGQGGLSAVILADINIDSIEYGDAAKGTSLSFGGVKMTGLGGFMLDVITGGEFVNEAIAALEGFGVDPANVAPLFGEVALQAGYQLGSDVVQIRGPDIDPAEYPDFAKLALNVSVDSISTGNGGASIGSLAIRGFNPVGSRIWMFGHD